LFLEQGDLQGDIKVLSAKSIIRGFIAASLLGGAAQAAPVAWSNASGNSTNFSWSDGANDQGLAGDPIAVNGTFIFIPSGLKAVAVNGVTTTTGEVIHVTLIPDAGRRISNVSATFNGDATVINPGIQIDQVITNGVQSFGSAGYSATLDATKHGTATHASNTLTPPDITTQGTFNDNLALAIPNGFGVVDLALSIEMHAIAGQSGSSLSEMKVVNLSVETAPAQAVPLPAAIVTFPAGAAVAAIAMRRMKQR
jgi:hypothetical protein